jgi:hypothetical protein
MNPPKSDDQENDFKMRLDGYDYRIFPSSVLTTQLLFDVIPFDSSFGFGRNKNADVNIPAAKANPNATTAATISSVAIFGSSQ